MMLCGPIRATWCGLSSSGLGTGVARAAVVDPDDEEPIHARLHDLIGRLEYAHERFAHGYVAIDLAPATSHEPLRTGLTALGNAAEIEWFDPLPV